VADIREVADGSSLGDIAKAVPVTFTLTPLAGVRKWLELGRVPVERPAPVEVFGR
jgi:hypothetical protein